MNRNSLEIMMEVEYIMNARYIKSALESLEDFYNVISRTPPTAAMFEIENKHEWLQRIKAEMQVLKDKQAAENKAYFKMKGL